MHAHGELIEYGQLWMVMLVRTPMLSHFSMEVHRDYFSMESHSALF